MAKGLTLAFVLLAAPVYAQHPCDIVPPTVFQEPSGQLAKLKLGWCFNPLDVMTGAPIAEPVGFSLVIDGGPDVDLGVVPALGAASATGWFYYEAQTPALKAGVITLKAYTASLGMSAASAPMTLTLLGPPKPPTNLRIMRNNGMGPQP
jgi:hypothetical protein